MWVGLATSEETNVLLLFLRTQASQSSPLCLQTFHTSAAIGWKWQCGEWEVSPKCLQDGRRGPGQEQGLQKCLSEKERKATLG